MWRDAVAQTPPAVARHVRRDIALAALAPLGSVVSRVVYRSSEAAVARDAARAVGSGQPADQAQRGPRHSRHSLALRGLPSTGEAAPRPGGDAKAARPGVGGHPTHRIGVDARGEGRYRTRVAWRYEREPGPLDTGPAAVSLRARLTDGSVPDIRLILRHLSLWRVRAHRYGVSEPIVGQMQNWTSSH